MKRMTEDAERNTLNDITTEVFGTLHCPNCVLAKRLLREGGIDYKERLLEPDELRGVSEWDALDNTTAYAAAGWCDKLPCVVVKRGGAMVAMFTGTDIGAGFAEVVRKAGEDNAKGS